VAVFLKPDVVFFGDYVPKQRVYAALDALKASDGLLVIGSSLMVYSGFRFCRYAHEWGKPIATLNLGRNPCGISGKCSDLTPVFRTPLRCVLTSFSRKPGKKSVLVKLHCMKPVLGSKHLSIH